MVLPGLRSLKSLLGSTNKRGNSGRKRKEKGDAFVVESGPAGALNSSRVGGESCTEQREKASCKVAGHRQVHPENHTIDKMMHRIGDLQTVKQDPAKAGVASPKSGPKCLGGVGKVTGYSGGDSSTSPPPTLPYHRSGVQMPLAAHHGPTVAVGGETYDETQNSVNFGQSRFGGDCIDGCSVSWESPSSNAFDTGGGSRCHPNGHDVDGRKTSPEFNEDSEKHDPVKECLERRVEELEKILEDERHLVRSLKEEKTCRMANDDSSRCELKREQMTSNVAEDKLEAECYAYKAQVACLQEEMRKRELVMQNVLNFQAKLRQMPQEKSSVQLLYERKLHNCQLNVVRLEKLNRLLLSEIENLECVASSAGAFDSTRSATEGRDPVVNRVWLERMRYLEAENASLVVENEQQRMQYEKCLDDVANQVVQALLVQKSLQGECSKLRKHVADLEQQNQTLHILFQQQLQRRNCDQKIQFGGSFTLPDTRISTGIHCLPWASRLCTSGQRGPSAPRPTCTRHRSASPVAGRSFSCTSISSDCSTVDHPSRWPLDDLLLLPDNDRPSESEKISDEKDGRCQFLSSSHWRRKRQSLITKGDSWENYHNACAGGGCRPSNICRECCSCADYCRIRNKRVTRSLPGISNCGYKPKARPTSHSLVMGMADLLRLNGLKSRSHVGTGIAAASRSRCACSDTNSGCRFEMMADAAAVQTCDPGSALGPRAAPCIVRAACHGFDRNVEDCDFCTDFHQSSMLANNVNELSPCCRRHGFVDARCWPFGDARTMHCRLDARHVLVLDETRRETVIRPTALLPRTGSCGDNCCCDGFVAGDVHRDGRNGIDVVVGVAEAMNAVLSTKESSENDSFVKGCKADDVIGGAVVFDGKTSLLAVNGGVALDENSLPACGDLSVETDVTASSVVEDSERRSPPTTQVSRDEGYSTMSSDVQCDAEGSEQSRRASMSQSPDPSISHVLNSNDACEGVASQRTHLAAPIEPKECQLYADSVKTTDESLTSPPMAVSRVEEMEDEFELVQEVTSGDGQSAAEMPFGVQLDPHLVVGAAHKIASMEFSSLERKSVDAIAGDCDDASYAPYLNPLAIDLDDPRTVYHGGVRRTKSEGDIATNSKRQRCRPLGGGLSDDCCLSLDVISGLSAVAVSSSALHRSKGCLSLTDEVDCDGRRSCSCPVDPETFASLPDDDDWLMVENLDCEQNSCSTPEGQVATNMNCYSDEEICNWSLNLSSDNVFGSKKKQEDFGGGQCFVKRLTNRSSFWSQPSGSLPSIQEVDVEWDSYLSLPSKARLVHLQFLRDGECKRLWRKIRRKDGACNSWPFQAGDSRCRAMAVQGEVDSVGGWGSSVSCATSKDVSLSSVNDEEQFVGNSCNVLPAPRQTSTPFSNSGGDIKARTNAPHSPEDGDSSPVETHFKSDFYMLCKVESCRSLDTSCKNLPTADSGGCECRAGHLGIDFLQAVALRRGARPNVDGPFLLNGLSRSSERPLVLIESVPCSKPACRQEADRCVARNLVKETLHELSRMLNDIERCGCKEEEEKGVERRLHVAIGDTLRAEGVVDQPTDLCLVKEGLTTSWVHFESDVDLSDPKARANLLDSMLASSASNSDTEAASGSSTSISSEEDDIEVSELTDGDEERANSCKYQQLHEIHRVRRCKRAASDRDRCVLRYIPSPRPSILDRKDFFYRYGEKEQEAVASFDFLESMSTSVSDVDSLETLNERGRRSPGRRRRDPESSVHKTGRSSTSAGVYSEDDNRNHHRGPIQVTGGEGFSDGRTRRIACNGRLYRGFVTDMNLSVLTLTSQDDGDATERLSLSDSCAESFSCSSSSLNLEV